MIRFPLAAELPLPELPMSDFMRTIIGLRETAQVTTIMVSLTTTVVTFRSCRPTCSCAGRSRATCSRSS